MIERAVPPAGVRLFYLDDAGVLFSQPRQELHLLNTTATLIWSLMEEDGDEPAIVSALMRETAIDAARGREYVRAALDDWRAKGLLDGLEAASPTGVSPTETTDEPPLAAPASGPMRRYRLLSSRFLIRFSTGAQAAIVGPVLEHLECDDDELPTATIDVVETDRRIAVYRNGAFAQACAALDQLAPLVKSAVWRTVLLDEPYFLDIHAGVVSDGRACMLLPAAPGSGKSTLTAALVHAGFEYFSDEIALLAEDDLAVLPVPLALCVKDTGIDALASRWPRLTTLPIHRRFDGKRVVYLPPACEQRPADERPRPVRALVFPTFVPGHATSFAAMPRPEALQALLSQCLRVARPLEVERVERVVQWIAKLPCYALRYGETDAAVAAVCTVFPRPADPHRLLATI